MDERANGCRAFHGVRKPHINGDLSRFSAGTDKKQNGDGGRFSGIDQVGIFWRGPKIICEVQSPEIDEKPKTSRRRNPKSHHAG